MLSSVRQEFLILGTVDVENANFPQHPIIVIFQA